MSDLVLGLDVSTSCVGWCLLLDDTENTLVDAGAIDLKKIKDIFDKASAVRNVFAELAETYTVNRVGIEENLQAFRPGFSSAKTLITLARFNGVVSVLAHDSFCTSPQFVNVNHARKVVGCKIIRKSDISTKDQVLAWAKEYITPASGWPMREIKSGKRKGLVIPHESSYDIADAFVVAKSCVIDE